jgi:hypothetical protein
VVAQECPPSCTKLGRTSRTSSGCRRLPSSTNTATPSRRKPKYGPPPILSRYSGNSHGRTGSISLSVSNATQPLQPRKSQIVPGLASWTMDGYDFHVVSLSITTLSKYYGVSKTDITTSITLTLLFRSLGAAIFGIAGDFWGRKYPMVVNMLIVRSLSFGLSRIANNSIDRGHANVSLYLEHFPRLLRLSVKRNGVCIDIPGFSCG